MSEHDLELSVRGTNIMKRLGIVTVRELVRFTEDEILSGKCFGETSLREIRGALAKRGLRLGMSADEVNARPSILGNIVRGAGAAPQVAVEAEDEHPCCGDCEDSSRHLHERTDLRRKLEMSLAELELSVRATNCLESEGIIMVRDLVIRSDEELLEVRSFGETTLKEVKQRLAALGLGLGMRLNEMEA